MTTIDAASAWHMMSPLKRSAFAVVVTIGLAGCETSNNLLGGTSTPPQAAVAEQKPAAATQAKKGRVALAPVIGAPDAVAKQMQSQLETSIERQGIALAKSPGEPADYTLRGYIVSAKEKSGTKVSYIWDVTDPAGKRVNRITGEDIVNGSAAKDPWSAVTPQLTQGIADKTAASLASWLPTQQGAAIATAQPVPVANNVAASGTGVPPVTPAVQQAAAPAASATTTGSIGRDAGPSAVAVPSVSGAPGDGNTALRSAMTSQLDKLGLSGSGAQRYSVVGKVKTEAPKEGKQGISIDWEVKDPAGKVLATVSQNNKVPQGSLDGQWGETAQHAAEGAAVQIRQLINDHAAGKPIPAAAGKQAAATRTN